MGGSIGWNDYARAEGFLPWNAGKLVYNLKPKPHWIGKRGRFWYVRRGPGGKTFMVVDATVKPVAARPAFDHGRLAAALSTRSGTRYEGHKLPFNRIHWVGDEIIEFTIGKSRWRCNIGTYECEGRGDALAPWEVASPDGKWVAFVEGGNIHLRSREDGRVVQLTTDGEPDYGYGTSPHRKREITDRRLGVRPPAMLLWSPDGSKIITHRLDMRQVEKMHLIESVPAEGARPVLHSYRYALVGDEHVPLAKFVVIDVADGKITPIEHEPQLALTHSPFEQFARRVWLNDAGTKMYFVREERGFQAVELWEADLVTGRGRVVVREEGETFVQVGPARADGPIEVVAVLAGREEAIWWSERDGWGHLYLYGLDGTLKNQITRGPWVVHKIHHVDEEHGFVYFTAGGREAGRDPYYAHLYRATLDGERVELLTPEDAHHDISFAPDGRGFVDTYSRVDMAPVTVWRDVEHGRRGADAEATYDAEAVELERADVSRLLEKGWQWPKPFRVKARDGRTDLYGVMFYPPNFDETKRYAIVEDIYPGPQSIRTPKAFALDGAQAMAALGFIVITVDAPGTSFRSKAFHDAAHGKGFATGGSLGDHVEAIKQLAARRPYMDLERVGIYGHSGGGFAAAKALFKYPDFYKVGVSSAGNHDQRGYRAGWGERYVGLPDGDDRYDVQANGSLVHNLKGKLFLSFGELDDNVHPAMTIQLVDALIRANKHFDLLILPNRNHGYSRLGRRGRDGSPEMDGDPYFIRRRWDYFVEHLLGQEPVRDYVVQPTPADEAP